MKLSSVGKWNTTTKLKGNTTFKNLNGRIRISVNGIRFNLLLPFLSSENRFRMSTVIASFREIEKKEIAHAP